jgi:hypothetical protein
MAATISLDAPEEEILRAAREYKERELNEALEERERAEEAKRLIDASQRGGDSLSSIEIGHAKVLHKRYGQDVHSIVLAHGGSPRGLGHRTMYVRPSAKLQGDDAFDLRAPFLTTMMIPLPIPSSSTAEEVRDRYGPKLVEFVGTLSPSSPSVVTHYHESRDKIRWAPFFPPKRSHIGFYTKGKKHFLIATTHAGPELAADLRVIASEPGMTAVGLVADPRVNWIRRLSHRNCARVLHDASTHLGFETSFNRDIFAANDGILSLPLLARPCHAVMTNSIDMHHSGNVALLHGVSHPRFGGHTPLVHGGHFHGYMEGAHHEGCVVTTKKHCLGRKHAHKQRKLEKHKKRVHHRRTRCPEKGERPVETHEGFSNSKARYKTVFVVAN